MTDMEHIVIDDDEVIELPFHMISADAFAPDEERVKQLSQLIPEDAELLVIMEKKQKKINRKEREGVLDKSFEVQDFKKIKEWLER